VLIGSGFPHFIVTIFSQSEKNSNSTGTIDSKMASDDGLDHSGTFHDAVEDNDKHVAEAEQVKKFAKKETSFMRVFKGIALASIILAAVLVSTGTYTLLKSEEDDDFRQRVSC
jgi:hypothetical protein